MSTSSLTPSTYKLPKEKRKTWCILIYTEWDNWMDIFNAIKHEDFEFMCWCLHDSDLHDDGTLKKEHLHVRLKYKNQVWNSAICERTGLPFQYKIIEPVEKTFRGAVRYLTHCDYSNKHQYSLDLVGASDMEVLQSFFTDSEEYASDVEKQHFKAILAALKYDNFDSEMDFIEWCYDNGFQKVANKWKFLIHQDFRYYQGMKR